MRGRMNERERERGEMKRVEDGRGGEINVRVAAAAEKKDCSDKKAGLKSSINHLPH